MTDAKKLKPAAEMVKANDAHVLNESKEYRQARDALAAEEIELRRHIVRVAEQRRALPPGGEVTKNYRFEGKDGAVGFADLFGDKDTLVIYSFMYGPQRKTGCPMCTSQMSAWDGITPHVKQRAAFVMTARSPIERVLAYGKERGWKNLRLYSDPIGDYTRDYVSAEDADMPGYNVFTRKDGVIRHFWRSEGGKETADPGQDPHDAPDMSAMWTILDTTPEGRGTDWYPKLDDGNSIAVAQSPNETATNDLVLIARAAYGAYVSKDRTAIEALIADDFHFSSPLDNRLDRAAYFARCWPNSKTTESFKFIHLVQHGEQVFVTYEARGAGGHRFRNTEIVTVRGSKIVEVEVYFGWDLPHKAAVGGFLANAN